MNISAQNLVHSYIGIHSLIVSTKRPPIGSQFIELYFINDTKYNQNNENNESVYWST